MINKFTGGSAELRDHINKLVDVANSVLQARGSGGVNVDVRPGTGMAIVGGGSQRGFNPLPTFSGVVVCNGSDGQPDFPSDVPMYWIQQAADTSSESGGAENPTVPMKMVPGTNAPIWGVTNFNEVNTAKKAGYQKLLTPGTPVQVFFLSNKTSGVLRSFIIAGDEAPSGDFCEPPKNCVFIWDVSSTNGTDFTVTQVAKTCDNCGDFPIGWLLIGKCHWHYYECGSTCSSDDDCDWPDDPDPAAAKLAGLITTDECDGTGAEDCSFIFSVTRDPKTKVVTVSHLGTPTCNCPRKTGWGPGGSNCEYHYYHCTGGCSDDEDCTVWPADPDTSGLDWSECDINCPTCIQVTISKVKISLTTADGGVTWTGGGYTLQDTDRPGWTLSGPSGTWEGPDGDCPSLNKSDYDQTGGDGSLDDIKDCSGSGDESPCPDDGNSYIQVWKDGDFTCIEVDDGCPPS